MAGETVIKPDLQFIKQIMASGGESVKKCYQCDTCSVVCNLAPDNKPFPRKEMLQAQWGLKRGGQNPGHLAVPSMQRLHGLLPPGGQTRGSVGGAQEDVHRALCHPAPCWRRWWETPSFSRLLIAFPVLLLLAALKVTGHLAIPAGPIVYSKLFPTLLVDFIFVPAFFFAVAVLAKGVLAYWKDINVQPLEGQGQGQPGGQPYRHLEGYPVAQPLPPVRDHLPRSTNHLLVLFGFIFLAVVTSWGFLNEWVLHHESPYFLFSPIKLLAMVGTAALLYGIYNIIKERQANAEQAGLGSYFDWLFIYVVFAVGATGLLSWLFRLVGIRILAYPTYFLHLSSRVLPVLLRPLYQDGPHGVPHRGHALRPHVGPGLLSGQA